MSERNRLCVYVRVHVIITSALHHHQSHSPVVEVSTNRFFQIDDIAYRINTCPILVPIKESMLNKPVCPDVSLHLLTTDKIEVLAVPLIWTGVTRGVYIKVT